MGPKKRSEETASTAEGPPLPAEYKDVTSKLPEVGSGDLKALWRATDGSYAELRDRCSAFSNKFKEEMFSEPLKPSMPTTEDTEGTALESEGLSASNSVRTADALAIGVDQDIVNLPPLYSTRSTDGCLADEVNKTDSNIAAPIEAAVDIPQSFRAGSASESLPNYTGSSFGISANDVRKPSVFGFSSIPVGPLNPWYLSQGIPNFAKNSASSAKRSVDIAFSDSRRQTPDIIRAMISGGLQGSLSVKYPSLSVFVSSSTEDENPHKKIHSMMSEERDKSARLERALLSALIPPGADDNKKSC